MFEEDAPLSSNGVARRERILMLALEHAARMRRGRRVKGVAAAFVVALMILVSMLLIRQPVKTMPVAAHAAPHMARAPVVAKSSPVDGGPVIRWIETDPTITQRLAIRAEARAKTWWAIDDDQLLRALADARRPAGLIEVNGRTYLVPQ